jgi:hypothetical protein
MIHHFQTYFGDSKYDSPINKQKFKLKTQNGKQDKTMCK